MRTRKLLTAVLLIGVSVLALSGPARAQEAPSTTLKESNEECVKLLEDGKDVDDCQKAPSLILPAVNELIWGGLSFAVLIFLVSKFAWPGMKKGMEGRTERIRGDLAAADGAKADAQRILDDYKAQLADAKNESARIIDESRQQAEALKKDQEQRLQTELTEMRARATADVEAAKNQAIADLRSEVADLAIGAAEVVVQRNLDRDTQRQLVESYIDQVASRSN
ncbi:MAG: F0F1 ATP synthase subunit B [Acidimicrobiales bacterium]